MCADPALEGAKQMAAVIQLPRTSKWAKRDNQPPLRQPNQASRTREYLCVTRGSLAFEATGRPAT